MKQRKPAPNQQTFAEINGISNINRLTDNQRRILSLVACKLTQAEIAKKLKFSASYICQTIKKLETQNLIKKLETQRTKAGYRDYNNFYELSPELKGKIRGEITAPFTPFRAHHFLRKFQIITQSGPVSKDKRAFYMKSWTIRGGDRHKFWFPGKTGMPSVTIDVHPKTIVAYVDKGQQIVARSYEEAQQLGWLAIYQAKEKFVGQQHLFGIQLEVENVGKQIGKTHLGLISREDGPLAAMKKAQEKIPEERVMAAEHPVWIDGSVKKELGPEYFEIEMFGNNPAATPVEETIKSIANLPETIRAAMPEALAELEKIGPLTSEVHTVLAHIQGGQAVQNQVNQLIMMFSDVLAQQHKILDHLAKTGAKIE